MIHLDKKWFSTPMPTEPCPPTRDTCGAYGQKVDVEGLHGYHFRSCVIQLRFYLCLRANLINNWVGDKRWGGCCGARRSRYRSPSQRATVKPTNGMNTSHADLREDRRFCIYRIYKIGNEALVMFIMFSIPEAVSNESPARKQRRRIELTIQCWNPPAA